MFAEVVHGVARVILLEPRLGDFKARQIAVFTGSAMILVISFTTIRWLRAESRLQLIGVGFLWLFLTLGFELLLGRLVMGLSWERIASDYKLFEGGLMPIGLLVLTAAPLIAAQLLGEDRKGSEATTGGANG